MRPVDHAWAQASGFPRYDTAAGEKLAQKQGGMPVREMFVSERKTVPQFFGIVLCLMLTIAGFISAPDLGRGGPLPVTEMLDVWIATIALYLIFRTRVYTITTIFFILGYGLTRVLPALATESPFYDFAQAYRWLFYVFVVALAVGKAWHPVKALIATTWTLLVLAIIKGALTLFTIGVRPGLLLENNFEIPLFAGLVAVIYQHLGRWKLPIVLTLGLLTAIAGSRSGVLAFVVVAIFAVTQTRRANLFVRYLAFVSLPAAGLVAYNLFTQRAATENSLDRLNFLSVFLGESERWGPLTWIFGTTPITPLMPGSCASLSGYSALFSSSGDGSCYSVILHAFFLRVVFDAGIVGLIIAFGLMWWLMRKASVPLALNLTLLAVAATNSLSVSGLNNPYVTLPMIMAVLGASGYSRSPRASSSKQKKPRLGVTASSQAQATEHPHSTH